MATLIENVNRIYTDKAAIKQAIIDKGVGVPDGTSLDDYAGLIAQINSGVDVSGVTAEAADVLSGKVIVDADGNPITGTMTDNGAKTAALNCGGSYTIPAGYHNGSGKVTANSLASQTPATASAAQILSGQTAYVNGSKITGTMPNYSNQWKWMNSDNGGGCGVGEYTYSSGYKTDMVYTYSNQVGYLDGSTKIILAPKNEIEGKLMKGSTLFGISGTATSDATAAAGDILSGKTAYVNGSKLTGTMTNQGAKTAAYNPSSSAQVYTIPAGYHNGSGKITFNGLKNILVADGISNIQSYGWIDSNCTLGASYDPIVKVGVGESVSLTIKFTTTPSKYAYNFNNYGILKYNTYNSTAVAQDTSIATTNCSDKATTIINGVSKGITFASRAFKDANNWYVCRFMILVGL